MIDRYRAAVAEIQRRILEVQETAAQRNREAQELKRERRPFIGALFAEIAHPPLPHVSLYEELEAKVRQALAATELETQLRMLGEIRARMGRGLR